MSPRRAARGAAKKRVAASVAAMIRGNIDSGAEYLEGESDEEDQLLREAAEALADELERKSGR